MSETLRGLWYPQSPPMLDGETSAQYTDRLTGADKTDRRPYNHKRNRQCSIGYHDECSERDYPATERQCECPCHTTKAPRPRHDDPAIFALHDSQGVRVATGATFDSGLTFCEFPVLRDGERENEVHSMQIRPFYRWAKQLGYEIVWIETWPTS